jgi:hypothetical protein
MLRMFISIIRNRNSYSYSNRDFFDRFRSTLKKTITIASTITLTLTLSLYFKEAGAGERWPEGLKEAAAIHLSSLQTREFGIRDSTMLNPMGIVPANIFDRASHKCHEGSGQQYRRFGEPVYAGRSDDGSFLVQTTIQIFYRQGAGLSTLFEQPWKQGTDMAFQVSFDQFRGGWKVVLERELIQMDEIPPGMKEGGYPNQ